MRNHAARQVIGRRREPFRFALRENNAHDCLLTQLLEVTNEHRPVTMLAPPTAATCRRTGWHAGPEHNATSKL